MLYLIGTNAQNYANLEDKQQNVKGKQVWISKSDISFGQVIPSLYPKDVVVLS